MVINILDHTTREAINIVCRSSSSNIHTNPHISFHINYATEDRSKAILVAGCGGIYGFEILRVPYILGNPLTDSGEVVSLKSRPRSIPQTHFLVLISVRD
jgi:hypothetical protein